MNIEQNKWISKFLLFTYFVQYSLILLNIHLFFQYSLIHEWHKVKWITQNEIAKKFDIHFCSIFTYFQYSLIHDLALDLRLMDKSGLKLPDLPQGRVNFFRYLKGVKNGKKAWDDNLRGIFSVNVSTTYTLQK